MSKFQRIYWSKKFDWKDYSKLYNSYCRSKDNYYLQSSTFLVNSIKLSNSSKVIDLGCGTGALTYLLLKKYPKINILAIDLSKEMLFYYENNFKKEITRKQIKIINGNAEEINRYIKEKYDLIFISSALWDMEIEKTFKNLSRILKKNGKIIFNLPALVIEKEKGFIFFIEHFFRQTLNSNMIYRRIKLDYLKKVFTKYSFRILNIKEYSFKMSKSNIKKFFNLLKYRYPFILFPKNMPYDKKLRKCEKIFNESLKYIPKEGIEENGFLFIIGKK